MNTMTIKNAIKKLSKYGKVQVNSVNEHWIEYKGYIISFFPNGSCDPNNSITCEHTKRIGEKSDPNSDYFPGSFWPNLTQAINHVERMFESDLKRLQRDEVCAS